MSHAYFFGYGSLVDRRTHGFSPAVTAKASGWRRAWRARPERDLCYLTAIPDADTVIQGLVAVVPGQSWAELDAREHAYDRHDASHQITHPAPQDTVAIYAVNPDLSASPGPENPILLSYLDVVIHGYLQEFGQTGAAEFFATTDGWDAPVLNDRAEPIYKRAQSLSDRTREIVDQALADLNCRFY